MIVTTATLFCSRSEDKQAEEAKVADEEEREMPGRRQPGWSNTGRQLADSNGTVAAFEGCEVLTSPPLMIAIGTRFSIHCSHNLSQAQFYDILYSGH